MSRTRRVDKRIKTIKFLLSKVEAGMLKRQAKDFGLSVPVYVRMLIHQKDGV
jgi:hypothetical protein